MKAFFVPEVAVEKYSVSEGVTGTPAELSIMVLAAAAAACTVSRAAAKLVRNWFEGEFVDAYAANNVVITEPATEDEHTDLCEY
jgi:hypothetical protein